MNCKGSKHTWGRRWIIFILSSEKYVLIDSKSETARPSNLRAQKDSLNVTQQARRRSISASHVVVTTSKLFETELNWFALPFRMDFSITTRGSAKKVPIVRFKELQ